MELLTQYDPKVIEALTKLIATVFTVISGLAAAIWAIDFYKKHGFNLVTEQEKNILELYQQKDNSWKKFVTWHYEDSLGVIGYPKHGHSFLALSNRGRDKIALVELSLSDGSEKIIFEHKKVDVRNVMVDRIRQIPVLVNSMPDYPEIHVFDKKIKADLKHILETIVTSQDCTSMGVSWISTTRRLGIGG